MRDLFEGKFGVSLPIIADESFERSGDDLIVFCLLVDVNVIDFFIKIVFLGFLAFVVEDDTPALAGTYLLLYLSQ